MRTKDEIFKALVTDAVAFTYDVPGLRGDEALSLGELQERMDQAGLLVDPED